MKEVTIDSVRECIANLELQANYSPIGGRLNEFEIACLRELLGLLALREKTRRAVAYLKAVNDRSEPECKDVLVDYAIRELDGNDHRSAPPAPVVDDFERWFSQRRKLSEINTDVQYRLQKEAWEARAAKLDAGAQVVPDELVYKLLDIAKRADEEADECAYVEFSDKSMKHAREIAEWERRAATLQPVSQPYKLPGKEG
ncbi:hypothetical protein FZH95_18955 [Cronobacter sakazakii]|nr:hypothetical protein FZH95_18955 [Cronobacter sakazakii]